MYVYIEVVLVKFVGTGKWTKNKHVDEWRKSVETHNYF